MALPTRETIMTETTISAKATSAAINLINGNIADAKRLAKNVAWATLFCALRNTGHDIHSARLGADYLKTGEGWQQYCDSK